MEWKARLEATYAEWARAMQAQDAEWFRRHERADFVYIAPDGRVMDREAHVRHASQGVTGTPASTIRDVSLVGDAVVVGGEHRIARKHVSNADGDVADEVRVQFTSVWVEAGGDLLLVRHHTTLTTHAEES